ncbi:MAG: glycosyltransferase family 2 protein [Candidatus Omnitrophota bacterium]|nr:glycosyltransferase family 2 protein [Candidatus Omnitrophota bacterium]
MEIKCDLILLSWNNLEILKQCVDSILRYTRITARLIIVDNGSTEPGVADYLSSLKGNNTIEVRVILNAVNEGFAKGMNKGMKASIAPYVCLLNNDILVTDGWLEEIMKVAAEDPTVGIVNPSSNNFGLRFAKETTLNGFAATLKGQTGRWVEMGGCIGFCMLIKREVIEKVGCLDETYGYAYFEDTDFSRRAQESGYKCAMAKGCYVYHAEGKSGKFLKDKDETFRKSAEIFRRKWGRPLRVAYIVAHKEMALSGDIARSAEAELKAHNRVWIFQEEGVEIRGLPEHLDLMREILPRIFFNFMAFWNIIKKKKRFDRLYISPGMLRNMLGFYGRFRGSEIKWV